MIRFEVFIRCRQLAAAHAEKTYTVDATTFQVAAARGIRLFRSEPTVARRRLISLELRVTALLKAHRPREIRLIDNSTGREVR